MDSAKLGRRSKINCCVVGCPNSYINTTPDVKFYNFPNRWYESERKKIWIQSVKRTRSSNSRELWQPKIHDKICSVHFVGNVKSNNPLSPSFNPTIFPKEYLKPPQGNVGDRFQRHMQRLKKKDDSTNMAPKIQNEDEFVGNAINASEHTVIVQDFQCQCDINDLEDYNSEDRVFTFECEIASSTEVCVQANIPYLYSNKFTSFEDKCVGNIDDINCNGFHGVKSIKSDVGLSSLCGVTFDTFNLLLSYIAASHGNSKLSEKNALLLFFMKLKLGISFMALSILFDLHHTNVSKQFFKILSVLKAKMSNYIYWPSREVIDLTMPKAFKLHYPKCRAIIDCSEIKISQPCNIDDRIYTYSHYKGAFTAKFLVAIAPSGFITFVSKCYGGRSSDTFITNDSGFLNLLESDDMILADKGFPGILCKQDAVIVIPPFVHEGRLTLEEIEKTYTIASVRVHVERSIQRIKTYNILRHVCSNLFPYIDDILYMCCVLTNLQKPTIAECYDKVE